MSGDILPLDQQEEQGLLLEHIEQIVDGVLEDARHGFICSQAFVRMAVRELCMRSPYAYPPLQDVTLRWLGHEPLEWRKRLPTTLQELAQMHLMRRAIGKLEQSPIYQGLTPWQYVPRKSNRGSTPTSDPASSSPSNSPTTPP